MKCGCHINKRCVAVAFLLLSLLIGVGPTATAAQIPSPDQGEDLCFMSTNALEGCEDIVALPDDSLAFLGDSLSDAAIDSLERSVDAAEAVHFKGTRVKTRKGRDGRVPVSQFVPDPQRALWLSLVFPGAGQIYNRKYWKLPILYGGFLGCTYALLWNQQMYRDYSQAYLDIMDDDPNTHSYLEMLPPRYDITGREEQFKKIFKNKKNYFRRYRDLSAFCFVGVYLLSVVDAYVDAHLSVFDISPDLSLKVEPAVIPQQGIGRTNHSYGMGCSLCF